MSEIIIFLSGIFLGIIAIPLISMLTRFYLWTIPEFGIVEEKWKTEFEEKIDSTIKDMSARLKRQLYYGDEK
jgi:hypothetical protein